MKRIILGTLSLVAMLGVALLAFGSGGPVPAGIVTADFGDHSALFGLAGLLVNRDTLSNIFINLKTTFNRAFDAAPNVWQKIAMLVPSTGSQNDYKWLANFPRMRRWIGDKNVKSLEGYGYTIVNDDWEATVEVDRNDIEDDNLGILVPQAQGASFSAKQLPDEIVFELVNGAFTNICFDGQYFCDTDHVVAGASVSNKLTVVLSAASQAASIASIGAARTAMMSFKDDEGRPLNVVPNALLVGPALEAVGLALKNNERLEDGKPNLYKGTFELIVDARITSTTAWFMLDTTKPVKPFIYQERKAPVFVSQTDLNADDVFSRKKFKFGAEARAAGGYGFWQLAVGSTGAG